jgi:hypothetical protein
VSRPCYTGTLVVALVALAPRVAAAAWTTDGNPVCTYTGNQSYPIVAADSVGGLFVVWQDNRAGALDLYAQRMTPAGAIAPGWPVNGLPICTAAGDQKNAVMALDGAGGFFVAWEDYRLPGGESNVYIQRVTSTGTLATGWPVDGLGVCTVSAPQGYPCLTMSNGSAIVAWEDSRSGLSSDIYAQKIGATGAVQWATNGVPVCVAANNQLFAAIVADGGGGAIIAWQDPRLGDPDIYAQRLNSAGAAQWAANGVAVCSAIYEQLSPRMVPDGSGGAILTWDDNRNLNGDLYAQRINASGAGQWTANGVALCTDLAEQYGAALVRDGAGGAILTWTDYRGGSGDVYAARITATGSNPGWPLNGAVVCAAAGDQFDVTAAADAAGGLYVAWADARAGIGAADIYAQRLTSGGAISAGWSDGGIKVCSAINAQQHPGVVADGAGCLMAWADDRGASTDIYAYRSGGSSSVDVPLETPDLVWFGAPFPNPTHAGATLRFSTVTEGPTRIAVVDLAGRTVKLLMDEPSLSPGPHTLSWDGRDESEAATATGIYFVSFQTRSSTVLRKRIVIR